MTQDASKKLLKVNEVYDFAWSKSLWSDAARQIERSILGMTFIFVVVESLLCAYDGIEGVNIPYMISATITGVGFGDVSPQSQFHRAMTIVLFPFALGIIGLAVALVKARAMAKIRKKSGVEGPFAHGDNPFGEDPECHLAPRAVVKYLKQFHREAPVLYKMVNLLLQYLAVITIGTIFYLANGQEREVLKERMGEDMTFVDCVFLSTVVSNAIGYGHQLWGRTAGAKWFLTVYMLGSTIFVVGVIGGFANLYLTHKTEQMALLMEESVTWVHRADLLKVGKISQADYVLFKLQQLQRLDHDVLLRLTCRFSELDVEKKGFLEIGKNVPSASQVAVMERAVAGTDKTLAAAWKALKKALATQTSAEQSDYGAAPPRGAAAAVNKLSLAGLAGKQTRLRECHNFAWSRSLWREAAKEVLGVTLAVLALYMALSAVQCTVEGYGAIDSFYFMMATLCTVGLGDIAPTSQMGRGIAIFVIPLGLVTLGGVLSMGVAYEKSKPYVVKAAHREDESHRIALFNAVDLDGDSKLTLEEVLVGAPILGLSEVKAREVFTELDTEGKGYLELPEVPRPRWTDTVQGQSCVLLAELYGAFLLGALLMKAFTAEHEAQHLTWIDALYYGVIVSLTIGYGDICPVTQAGRLAMGFFFLFSTVIVGQILARGISIYVNDIIGEDINVKLLESTTFVHKMDINNTGVVSEADYVLFKLQQMQRVDAVMLDRLARHFHRLDLRADGYLDVGVDVPDAGQVKLLQKKFDLLPARVRANTSLAKQWRIMQATLGLDKNLGTRPGQQLRVVKRAPRSHAQFLESLTASQQEDYLELHAAALEEGRTAPRPPPMSPLSPGSKPVRDTKASAKRAERSSVERNRTVQSSLVSPIHHQTGARGGSGSSQATGSSNSSGYSSGYSSLTGLNDLPPDVRAKVLKQKAAKGGGGRRVGSSLDDTRGGGGQQPARAVEGQRRQRSMSADDARVGSTF
eukprot:CAMPEP_0172589832 /NCGR_PEP_ID=MMETSP1068-20121228/8397_1 /TAXON_ID=35684 /ORGANISM="Pseudopedinella elastica, Strain CCMP716" /LENGTH=972 /DNA_ID=CAMNT_0013385485 /DNA_START=130 /DNA_END=3048 /DNA_ORIENTATION=+